MILITGATGNVGKGAIKYLTEINDPLEIDSRLQRINDFIKENELNIIQINNRSKKLNKRLLLIIISLTTYSFIIQGQGNPNRKERLEAHKIAFITRHLNLSVEEAQKFWPV